MTNFFKRTVAIATLAGILAGTVMSAQAQVVRPAPNPSDAPGGVTVENRFDRTECFSHQDALKRLTREWKHAGYLATYRPRYYDNNTKVQLFGVKAGDQWYAFTFDMCKGRILEEGKLKSGKPGFIDGSTEISG